MIPVSDLNGKSVANCTPTTRIVNRTTPIESASWKKSGVAHTMPSVTSTMIVARML